MSQVFSYRGQNFRIEVVEVASPDEPSKVAYASWYSDAFRDLQDMPNHRCTRLAVASPVATREEALRAAYDRIKSELDADRAKQTPQKGSALSVLYTVWVFKGDVPFGLDFQEFSDAKAFAAAAEKSIDASRIGIKNNESPQFLTLWERK
jgi:hypothetical protein